MKELDREEIIKDLQSANAIAREELLNLGKDGGFVYTGEYAHLTKNADGSYKYNSYSNGPIGAYDDAGKQLTQEEAELKYRNLKPNRTWISSAYSDFGRKLTPAEAKRREDKLDEELRAKQQDYYINPSLWFRFRKWLCKKSKVFNTN